VIDQSLNKICLRERELIAAWITFQEEVVPLVKEGVSMASSFFRFKID